MSLPKKKILITRSSSQSKEFIKKLEDKNISSLVFPTIEIEEINSQEIDAVFFGLYTFDWIIFTSVNTVDIFFNKLAKLNIIFDFSKIKIAVIGSKVADALEKRKIIFDIIPQEFVSESLVKAFSRFNLKNKNILIPCSNIARDLLYDELKKQGAMVKQFSIYSTKKPSNSNVEEVLNSLINSEIGYITFTSPSTVSNFFEILNTSYNEEFKLKLLLEKIPIICIGPTTAKKLKDISGLTCSIPEEHTIEGMIEIICS